MLRAIVNDAINNKRSFLITVIGFNSNAIRTDRRTAGVICDCLVASGLIRLIQCDRLRPGLTADDNTGPTASKANARVANQAIRLFDGFFNSMHFAIN